MRLISTIAENDEHRVVLSEFHGVPKPGRHENRVFAALERKPAFVSAIFADDIYGAVDADHELRAQLMRVAAARGAGRSRQSKHALDPEWYLRCSFSHDNFAVGSRVPRQ